MFKINLTKSIFCFFPVFVFILFFSCDDALLDPINTAIKEQASVDPPVALFSADPLIGITPLQVAFTNTSTGNIDSIEWDFDNNGITDSTEENPIHSFETAVAHTSYSVCLTVNGAGGTDKEIKTDFIDVYLQINSDFTADVTEGDYPLTVQFSDNSAGDITDWDWDFGDGESSTLQNPSHTYDDPGKYTVELTVTDSLASTDDEIKTDYITVHPWHGIKTINTNVVEDWESIGGLAVSGDNVYIVYTYFSGTYYRYLRFAKSIDGGETFAYTTLDSNSYWENGGTIMYPSLNLNGTNIYVSYLDYMNAGNNIITFRRSTDSGASWESVVSVSTLAAPDNFSKPSMANYGTAINITTYNGNNADISYRYSYGGLNWYTGASFDTDSFTSLGAISEAMTGSSIRYFVYDGYMSGPGTITFCNEYGIHVGSTDYSDVFTVRDTSDGDDIYIAHHSSGDLYCNISTVGGAGSYSPTWTEYSLDTTGDVGEYPSIVVDGSYIYISYYDATNTALKFVKSGNGGTSWSAPITVDNSASVGRSSQIAVSGAHVYIIYFDNSNYRIKLAKSVDRGDSW